MLPPTSGSPPSWLSLGSQGRRCTGEGQGVQLATKPVDVFLHLAVVGGILVVATNRCGIFVGRWRETWELQFRGSSRVAHRPTLPAFFLRPRA